jgi:hypothetical protein
MNFVTARVVCGSRTTEFMRMLVWPRHHHCRALPDIVRCVHTAHEVFPVSTRTTTCCGDAGLRPSSKAF